MNFYSLLLLFFAALLVDSNVIRDGSFRNTQAGGGLRRNGFRGFVGNPGSGSSFRNDPNPPREWTCMTPYRKARSIDFKFPILPSNRGKRQDLPLIRRPLFITSQRKLHHN